MSDNCLECKEIVTNRQHTLMCGGCSQWQHRVCGTGISLQEYRKAIKEEKSINWFCNGCSFGNPLSQSTPVYNEDLSFNYSVPSIPSWVPGTPSTNSEGSSVEPMETSSATGPSMDGSTHSKMQHQMS